MEVCWDAEITSGVRRQHLLKLESLIGKITAVKELQFAIPVLRQTNQKASTTGAGTILTRCAL